MLWRSTQQKTSAESHRINYLRDKVTVMLKTTIKASCLALTLALALGLEGLAAPGQGRTCLVGPTTS